MAFVHYVIGFNIITFDWNCESIAESEILWVLSSTRCDMKSWFKSHRGNAACTYHQRYIKREYNEVQVTAMIVCNFLICNIFSISRHKSGSGWKHPLGDCIHGLNRKSARSYNRSRNGFSFSRPRSTDLVNRIHFKMKSCRETNTTQGLFSLVRCADDWDTNDSYCVEFKSLRFHRGTSQVRNLKASISPGGAKNKGGPIDRTVRTRKSFYYTNRSTTSS